MRRVLAGLTTTVMIASTMALGGAATASGAAQQDLPRTIPALRSWTSGGTGYSFAAGARVVAATSALGGTAQQLATDLKSVTGVEVPAVVGGTPRAGDVVLRLGSAPGGTEGYRLTVAATTVVEANAEAGAFYGGRSVLQLLRQSRTLPGGTATDWPLYPERGLMVDAGRKYFSLPWLRERIRDMAYLKLNVLHLHLSDVHGFRLESASHPEVTSAQHYTKHQLADLIAYAARYHVRIVPELDFPGHMNAILASHPELKLVSRTGVVNDGFIDLSKPAAYGLMRDLITEYLPLFPHKYWHIGADEYVTDYDDYPQLAAYAKQQYGPNATGKDAYYGFINWANDIVRAGGKTARMWNDGLKPGGATLTVNPNIVVEHWSMSGPWQTPWFGDAYSPSQLVANGHKILNAAITPTYYTVGGYGESLNRSPGNMYESWDPNIFVDSSRLSAADQPKNLGSKLHVWCDEPDKQTEAQIATAIRERLRVMAQHTWRTPSVPFYWQFVPIMDAVGPAPG